MSVAPERGGEVKFSEDFLCCPCSCVVSCLLPCCTCCACPCLLMGHKDLKKRFGASCVDLKFTLSHSIQMWLLTHPACGVLPGCCGLLPTVAHLHDINLLGGSMYRGYHDLFGESYCVCGKVLTTEPEVMERYLTGPQGRGAHLHSYRLLPRVLPTASGTAAANGKCPFEAGDDTFLLSMPNRGDANEPHAVLRALLIDQLLTPDALRRGSVADAYAKQMLLDFKAAYEKQKAAGSFAWSDVELPNLVLAWFHYALFGLQLDDDAFATLRALYLDGAPGAPFPPNGVVYYFFPDGIAGGKDSIAGSPRTMSELKVEAVKLYAASPALQSYPDDAPLSKLDFCAALIPVLALAAVQGPLSGAQGCLKGKWHGEVPDSFEWPYADRDRLRLVVMETQRLRPSVFGSTALPDEDFAVVIAGRRVVFPAGTPLVLNYRTAGTREQVWTEPKEFKPYERAAQLWGPTSSFWAFNSCGERTHGDVRTGRICPGRDLALSFLLDLLQALFTPEGK